MRRTFAQLAVVAVLFTGSLALAEEAGAPTTVADSGSNDTTASDTGSAGGSAFKQAGALLDKSNFNRPMMLSFFAEFPYGYYWAGGFGIGVGARFAIPILKNGFLPMLNDSFWIEFGADTNYFFFPGFSFGLTIPAQAMWMFHLIPKLAVYAKLSLGVHLQFFTYSYVGASFWAWFHGAGGLGVVYNLSDKFALRAEVMSDRFNAGISILF